jgi:hypothetical protein
MMPTLKHFGWCGLWIVHGALAQGVPPGPVVPMPSASALSASPLRQEQDPAQRLLQEQKGQAL